MQTRLIISLFGGHAFGVHAEPRTTKDLDIFIRSNPENARASVSGSCPNSALRWVACLKMTLLMEQRFRSGVPPDRIDILQKIDGVTFDEAWPNRISGTIDGEVPACVISREDLIRNKLASGREQDLLDVKVLRKAEKSAKRQE